MKEMLFLLIAELNHIEKGRVNMKKRDSKQEVAGQKVLVRLKTCWSR